MPPSGYNLIEAKSITSFLDSICKSLIDEGKEKKLSPQNALKAECNNIQIILNSECSAYQSVVLSLTRHFYKSALSENPKSYEELRSIMKKELELVGDDILSIHVPEI